MSKKVYELAKELDIGSVDLVEKIRGFGLNIRNHMVKLSDEELAMVMDKLKGPKVATKKAATKKKVTKKKVAKKSAKTLAEEAEKESKPTKTKVITVRKKKIVKQAAPVVTQPEVKEEIAKTSAVKEELSEAKPEQTNTKVSSQEAKHEGLVIIEKAPIAEPIVKVEAQPESTEIDEEQAKPLDRLVNPKQHAFTPIQAAPEAKKVKAEAPKKTEGAKVEAGTKKVDKLFKEKMHTFTPIYVPEKKAEEPAGAKKVGATSEATTSTSTESADDANKNKSKKRIGDLAAIVNKKTAEKSKDIGMLRAEEELKFATTLVGNNVYIPARRKKNFIGKTKQTLMTEVKDSKRLVRFHDVIFAKDLAMKLSIKFQEFANKLLDLNLLVKENDYIGVELASEIAALYDYRVENVAFDEAEIISEGVVDKPKSDLPLRSPIITVMGHVDHGKTTLLDTIRKEKVASGEAGGITQHIGAYSVDVKGSKITFLDTPGHAAFASMRQRGANLTDIVILVVAADDGVMPQTVESIKFIKKAGVPLIVAVNKMDKEGASPDRIKNALGEFNIIPEEWGGDVQFVEISALEGDGIDDLLEAIHLQAEIMELRETSKGNAEGVIIESKVESGRGAVCTVLVRKGTLSKGDAIVVGEFYGRARSLVDHQGKMIQSAGPSTPVQILGLDGVAVPGETLNVVKSEREAKKIVENRENERKELEFASKKKMSLEDFFGTSAEGEEKKVLKLIVRADVIGSYEAIKNSLEAIGNEEVGVEVVQGGAGAITDNDVSMAESIDGYIIGFNMRPVTSARKLAEQKGIDVKTYSIIYELLDDIKLALEGMLEPDRVEVYIGRAQVKETFTVPKIGVIAGSSVIDGKIAKGCNVRLLRQGRILFDGKLSSLRRFKDDVNEVKNGYECGVALDGYDDIQKEDIFEAYILEEKKRSLDAPKNLL